MGTAGAGKRTRRLGVAAVQTVVTRWWMVEVKSMVIVMMVLVIVTSTMPVMTLVTNRVDGALHSGEFIGANIVITVAIMMTTRTGIGVCACVCRFRVLWHDKKLVSPKVESVPTITCASLLSIWSCRLHWDVHMCHTLGACHHPHHHPLSLL